MKKIVLTGSEGRIGKIIRKSIRNYYEIFSIDCKKITKAGYSRIDIASEDISALKSVFKGKDAVIHLAWDNNEDFPVENIIPNNKKMVENVLRAAREEGVSKIILASSVHVSDYSRATRYRPIRVEDELCPDSLYGVTKIYLEYLGKYYANRYGIKVVCIRFGGLNPLDKPLFAEDPIYDKVLLKKADACSLIRHILDNDQCPDFSVLYAVSKSQKAVHDTSNHFGWS